MVELGYCQECGKDLSGYDLSDLPSGEHGLACPNCDVDVYCGICGDMTTRKEKNKGSA